MEFNTWDHPEHLQLEVRARLKLLVPEANWRPNEPNISGYGVGGRVKEG